MDGHRAGASPSPASASSRRAASASDAFWDGPARPRSRRRAPASPTSIPSRCFDNPRRPAAPTASRSSRSPPRPRRSTQAGEPGVDPAAPGVIFGTGVGGLHTLEEQIRVDARQGPPAGLAVPRADDDGQRRRRRRSRCATGWQGPCETIVTACAAGTHAIGNAARLIACGRCDAVLTGGVRGGDDPGRHRRASRNMTALSTVGHLAAVRRRARRLRDRRGRRRARARGVGARPSPAAPRSSARSSARRSNADAHHITAPSPGGAGAVACMELALADAGLDAGRHRARSTPTAPRRR